MNFEKCSHLFYCLLNLKREIVAVDIARTKEEFDHWLMPDLKRPLSFCTMVRLASNGYKRKASGNSFGCPGSSEVFRFNNPIEGDDHGKRLFSLGLYATLEIAKQVQDSMARLPAPCAGVGVMPLKACEHAPKSIIFFVNAYQAMRLVQGWVYHFGTVDDFTLTGNRGICSECVAKPISTGSLHLSPLCSNTRYSANWGDQELGLGLPFSKVERLLDGVIKTLPAVETEERKKAIVQRCSELDLNLDIPLQTSYYSCN